MARAFALPDLGEGIHEGEVLAVMVAVGDDVKEGAPILEVETDKAAVEIPSPYTARVEEILVKPGDTVQVGQVLMTFSGEGDEAAPVALPALRPWSSRTLMSGAPARPCSKLAMPISFTFHHNTARSLNRITVRSARLTAPANQVLVTSRPGGTCPALP